MAQGPHRCVLAARLQYSRDRIKETTPEQLDPDRRTSEGDGQEPSGTRRFGADPVIFRKRIYGSSQRRP